MEDNLRILAINSLYFDNNNLFINKSDINVANQWNFIVNTLSRAADNGERVWIVGHIPITNGEATQLFMQRFIELRQQFKDVIDWGFFGHTHHDSYLIYNNTKEAQYFGVDLIAPSLMPDNHNPTFRIYNFTNNNSSNTNGSIMVNYKQYTANLTDANKNNKLNYTLFYSFRDQYNLSPTINNYGKLALLMQENLCNNSLFDKFYYNYWVGNKEKANTDNCNLNCRLQMIKENILNI